MANITSNVAHSADGFLDSIGINVHMAYIWTSYADVTRVQDSLEYIGVNHIRDKLLNWGDVQANYHAMAEAGYVFDFLLPVYDPHLVNIDEFVSMVHDFVVMHPDSISALEGPNEVNIWPGLFQGGTALSNQAALQRAFFTAVNADPLLADIPVYNLTMAFTDASQYAQLGNLSDAADYANMHPYVWSWGTPKEGLAYLMTFPQMDAPGLTNVITETGYSTLTSDGYSGVSEQVQAKFTLDLLLDSYKMGVERTFLYELLDTQSDPSGSDGGAHWGLFNADGTPKLAATALHNFTSILDDPNPEQSAAINTLAYSVSNLPAKGDQLLFQKGDGTFDLVVWAESQLWDPNTRSEVIAPNTEITVNFGQVQGVVYVYDPLVGKQPVATYSNISELRLTVSDHPLIIEIPPSVPLAVPSVLSFSPDTNVIGDGITNADHILLNGIAAAGSSVQVFDGATKIGTVTANGSGAWSFATAALADGNHAFTSKTVDASGHVSAASGALNVKVDTVAPGAPTLAFAHDQLTGTAEAGSTVQILENSALVGITTANADGAWTFATGPGHNSSIYSGKAIDAAGNVSVASVDLHTMTLSGGAIGGGPNLDTTGAETASGAAAWFDALRDSFKFHLDQDTSHSPVLAALVTILETLVNLGFGAIPDHAHLNVSFTPTGYDSHFMGLTHADLNQAHGFMLS